MAIFNSYVKLPEGTLFYPSVSIQAIPTASLRHRSHLHRRKARKVEHGRSAAVAPTCAGSLRKMALALKEIKDGNF